MQGGGKLSDAPENYTDAELIEAYLLHGTKVDDPVLWPFDEMNDLVRNDPERAWPIILALARRSPDADFVAFLAAGPMEQLLCYHGRAFIERVEQRAATDPKFSYMLGGVWKSDMQEDVWDRLTRARKEVW